MKLLIVESPTKARTLTKILGNHFKVLASKGHIRDLPEKSFGVDIERDFKPRYVILKGKNKIVKELKETSKNAKEVYLGCDPDREGEAIAYHIMKTINHPDTKRVLFHEITHKKVESALANPTTIDINKVYSQQARRILDRIVGYTISPILWRVIKKGLSAGRVQTVALRLIVEKEQKIESFVKEKYYIIEGIFEYNGEKVRAGLSKVENKKFTSCKNKESALSLKRQIIQHSYKVTRFKVKETTSFSPPPFKTSTLQQEASSRFGFSPSKTMRLAQNLYEGKDIDGDTTGIITYMRTDSLRLSEDAIKDIRKAIKSEYGAEFLPKTPKKYRSKGLTQEAHEAIRPTNLQLKPEKIKDFLSSDEYKLYNIIYRRTLSSQMKNARFEKQTLEIQDGNFTFTAEGRSLIFEGYYKALGESPEVSPLPSIPEGKTIRLLNVEVIEKETEPPKRFTESSLIKQLEKNGVGRPSTYAPTISTLYDRGYMLKEGRSLKPTELGKLVCNILLPRFPNIFDVQFTARMEEGLDKIEEAKEEWQSFLSAFYKKFSSSLNKVKNNIKEIKRDAIEPTGSKCPKCGGDLVYRWSKYGKFIGCSNFPKCNYKENILEGKVPCPKCEKGILVKKKGKKKIFYGCSKYPDCDYSIPGEPVEQKCAKCGFPIIQIIRKGRGSFLLCPECGKFIKRK